MDSSMTKCILNTIISVKILHLKQLVNAFHNWYFNIFRLYGIFDALQKHTKTTMHKNSSI